MAYKAENKVIDKAELSTFMSVTLTEQMKGLGVSSFKADLPVLGKLEVTFTTLPITGKLEKGDITPEQKAIEEERQLTKRKFGSA